MVLAKMCLYPWSIVFDFEAILSPISGTSYTSSQMAKKMWTHLSPCVTQCGWNWRSQVFGEWGPKGLIEEMITYMESSADAARVMTQSKWTSDPTSNLTLNLDIFHCMDYFMGTEGDHILHAQNPISDNLILIWRRVMIPALKRCMCSIGAIFMDVPTVKRIWTIWVETGKCILTPKTKISATRDMAWRSYENMNSNCSINLITKWNSSLDNVNLPSVTNIVRSQKSTILNAVLGDTVFSFLEVDIHVSNQLHPYFEEMPLFYNSEVKFEDMDAFIQQYVRDHRLTDKPCCFLLGRMKIEKIILSSPYLKWLL